MADTSSLGADASIPPFKCVVLGDANVGKTTLIQRFITNKFVELSAPTQGQDFFSKTVHVKSGSGQINKLRLQIWDTAGGEKFRSLTKMYFKNAKAIILCYDSTDLSSFEALQYWEEQINQHVSTDSAFEIFIVSTKIDLADKEAVNIKKAYKFSQELNAELHQSSAKDGTGIDRLFDGIGKKMMFLWETKLQDQIAEFKED